MTNTQIETATGLHTRHILSDESHAWLSYQIGRIINVTVKTSTYRSKIVPVFQLLAWGHNWDAAYGMFLKR